MASRDHLSFNDKISAHLLSIKFLPVHSSMLIKLGTELFFQLTSECKEFTRCWKKKTCQQFSCGKYGNKHNTAVLKLTHLSWRWKFQLLVGFTDKTNRDKTYRRWPLTNGGNLSGQNLSQTIRYHRVPIRTQPIGRHKLSADITIGGHKLSADITYRRT